MNFPPFREEHDQVRALARQFFESEVAPNAEEWDRTGKWPHREIFQQLGELGLLGIRYPEQYGGMGLDWWYTTAWIEGLGYARNGGIEMSISVHSDMATPIIDEIGTPEQKEEFLTGVITGTKIAALGITEPNCGSDVSAITTTARKDGGDYIIDGAKTFITNGAICDFVTLAVRTGGPGHHGISLMLFPTDTPGFTVGRKMHKVGTRSVDSCELHFDKCRIPQRYLLGEENAGFRYVMTNFQGERLVAALTAIHSMERAIESALEYGAARKVFGKSVLDYQVSRHKLAEHYTNLHAAKSLAYRAVDAMNEGGDATEIISMAKLFASDLAQKVVYDCQQLFGGYGYIEEYPIARLSRDVRLMTIGGGTSEIMKEIIWKRMERGRK